MRRSHLPALALTTLLFALTGCAGGATPSSVASPSVSPAADATASPDAGGADDAGGIEGCVNGEWSADLDDLVTQLGEQMAYSGASVAAAESTGDQVLSISDGALTFSTDMTFVLGIDMGDGTTMTMTQQHTGTMDALWAWSGQPTADTGLLSFSNFDSSGYTVNTTIEVGGQSVEAPFTPPNMAAADVPTRVTCLGDFMTTHPEGSPYATTWVRSS